MSFITAMGLVIAVPLVWYIMVRLACAAYYREKLMFHELLFEKIRGTTSEEESN